MRIKLKDISFKRHIDAGRYFKKYLSVFSSIYSLILVSIFLLDKKNISNESLLGLGILFILGLSIFMLAVEYNNWRFIYIENNILKVVTRKGALCVSKKYLILNFYQIALNDNETRLVFGTTESVLDFTVSNSKSLKEINEILTTEEVTIHKDFESFSEKIKDLRYQVQLKGNISE